MTSNLTSPLTRAQAYPLAGPLGTILNEGRARPLVQVDRVNGIYKANGVIYASEAAALAALDPNRVISGITAVLGPVVVPGASEMVTNGSFDTDIAGWTAGQNSGGPAAASWDTGKLLLTVNGATGSQAYQYPPLVAGESYLQEGDVTRNGADVTFTVMSESTGSFQQTVGMSQQSNGEGHKKGPFIAAISRSRIALRQNTSAGTDCRLDNATIKLCRPTGSGWKRKHRWIVNAVAKVSPTNTEWLLCLTNNASSSGLNYDYLAVYRRQSDGHIIVEMKSQVCQITNGLTYLQYDLGAVADGATFTVELRVSNRIKAGLNGGALQTLPATAPVNYPIVCIGKAFYGGTTVWTGTINSYQIDFPSDLVDSAFSIVGCGHSLPYGNQASPVAGLTGMSWYARLIRDELDGAAWYNNIAHAGASSQQIRDGVYGTGTYADDLTRNPEYGNPRTVLVIWAIENDAGLAGNGPDNIADIVSKWQSINAGGRFIVVEPLLWSDLRNQADMLSIRSTLRATYGAQSLDLAGYITAPTVGVGGSVVGDSCQGLDDAGIAVGSQLPADKTDFDAGVMPASLRAGTAGSDQIHPNNLGSIPISKAFAQKFAELEYV